jgi:hypothetical protein
VRETAAQKHAAVAEDSIQYFFRRLEISVGARVALPSVAVLVEEWEQELQSVTLNSWLVQRLGDLASVRKKIKESMSGWHIPETATSMLELLSSAQLIHGAPLLAADTEVVRIVNLVQGRAEDLKSLAVMITHDVVLNDGGYFIAGKLSEVSDTTMFMVAELACDGATIAESRCEVRPGSSYFTLEFNSIPNEICILDNVKMLLVGS